jgi:hypothetical protein
MIKSLIAASVLTLGLAGLAFAEGAPPASSQIITEAPTGHAVRYDGHRRYVFRDGCWVYGHGCYAYRHGRYVYRYELGHPTGNVNAAPVHKQS